MDIENAHTLSDVEKVLVPLLKQYVEECDQRNLCFLGAVNDIADEIYEGSKEAA